MGLKKSFSFFLSIVIMLFTALNIADADVTGVLVFGRIDVKMPQITAEIKGNGYDKAAVSAVLGNDVLQVNEVVPYNSDSNSVCAYILVDLSKSMRSSFELMKTNISRYVNSMGANDRVILITFGENEVTTLLDGDESKEEVLNTVNSLKCTENGTMFYEALARAYQLSNASVSEFDREYVLVFSDGIDEQKGNSTYEEIANSYKTHSLPVYAVCPPNTSKEAADRFGELARSSGGSFMLVADEAGFDSLLSDINNVILIKFLADSNAADGSERQLSVKIGDLQVEQSIPIVRSIDDNTPPSVNEIYYDEKSKSVFITFSEPVNGLLDAASYNIKNKEGTAIEISSVSSAETQNQIEIKLKELHNGEYSVSFPGITDSSKEANPLSESKTFNIKNITEEDKKEQSGLSLWIIILIIAVLILAGTIIIIVIVSNKKKDNSEQTGSLENNLKPPVNNVQHQVREVDVIEHEANVQKQVKYHIKNNDSIKIALNIKTGNNAVQRVNMDIVSSLIVGRASACDICIDDTKLSRQHFVIEYSAGSLFLTDLQSRNGTMLNGVRIGSRQKLKSGDKIFAGLSDMIIQF